MSRHERSGFVVVPLGPGPLVVLDPGGERDRDELDDLVDDLFPDVDEGPGWFDAGLAVAGIGLLAWGRLGDGPGLVTVLGTIALLLACILPVREGWRWYRQRTRARLTSARLAAGVALDASSPAVAALIDPYRALFGRDATTGSIDASLLGHARGAAHAALLEVATLLDGRTPTSEGELGYVDQRATAVAGLVESLRELPDPRPEAMERYTVAGATPFDPDVLVAAREELDRLAPITSVTRIEQVTAEVRQQRGR